MDEKKTISDYQEILVQSSENKQEKQKGIITVCSFEIKRLIWKQCITADARSDPEVTDDPYKGEKQMKKTTEKRISLEE